MALSPHLRASPHLDFPEMKNVFVVRGGMVLFKRSSENDFFDLWGLWALLVASPCPNLAVTVWEGEVWVPGQGIKEGTLDSANGIWFDRFSHCAFAPYDQKNLLIKEAQNLLSRAFNSVQN